MIWCHFPEDLNMPLDYYEHKNERDIYEKDHVVALYNRILYDGIVVSGIGSFCLEIHTIKGIQWLMMLLRLQNWNKFWWKARYISKKMMIW